MNEVAAPQQLTLLASPPVNARFRLSEDTRERGLRHVAEIRQMLAERRAARSTSATSAALSPGGARAA